MAAATQYTVLLGIEGVDMSRTSEGLRTGGGIGQCLDGLGTVVGRNAGGAALQFVDSYGEGRAQYRGVVLHLMGQVEFFTTLDGDGGAEYATGVLQHEVHLLGGDLLGGDHQVALVLAVFVIDHDHELAFCEVCYSLFYCVELK